MDIAVQSSPTRGAKSTSVGYHRRMSSSIRATTVVCVRRDGKIALGSDGQGTLDKTVLKQREKKRPGLPEGRVRAGSAGATADAFTLFERFEAKLKEFSRNLPRAAVELAKDWRTDRLLPRLERRPL